MDGQVKDGMTYRVSDSNETYTLTAETGADLGVNSEFLAKSYSAIYDNAVRSAPGEIKRELVISQDGKVKTTFHIKVSARMSPYLIKAIQDQNLPGYGTALRSYFHKLQENVMAQLFRGVGELSFPKFG